MDAERYERVFELFQLCLPLGPGGREQALDSVQDADLRAEVRRLLDATDETSDSFSDTAVDSRGPLPVPVATPDVRDDSLPDSVGPFRVLRRIGAGGMGTVYEARQESPQRSVALKLLHPDAAFGMRLKRFRLEAEMLGQLQHPGIAQVYEAGTCTLDGSERPYFAMELVRGTSIVAYAERESLALDERLELVARLCDAVQHAHDHGIVHRDLKPDNVLVDEHGQPKVLDFGVAQARGTELALTTVHTAQGEIVGTITHMAPEQLFGDPDAVGPHSDVYALGVIAFELASGRLPHEIAGLSLTAAVRHLTEAEPTRLGAVDRRLRGDVETVVDKALRREPERRYVSPAAFGADLRRILARQPVTARPATRIYRLRRYAQRNPALVGGTLATLVAIVAGVLGVLDFAARESTARIEAERATLRGRRALYDAVAASIGAGASRWDARRQLSLVPEPERGWEWSWLSSQAPWTLPGLTGNATFVDARRAIVATKWSGGPARSVLVDLASGTAQELPEFAGTVAFARSADGRFLATTEPSHDGPEPKATNVSEEIFEFEPETLAIVGRWPSPPGFVRAWGRNGIAVFARNHVSDEFPGLFGVLHESDFAAGGPVLSIGTPDVRRNNVIQALSPDGTLLAFVAAAEQFPSVVRLYRTDTGAEVARRETPGLYRHLCFAPRGDELASVGRRDVEILAIPSLEVVRRFEPAGPEMLSTDRWDAQDRIALVTAGAGIRILDARTGAVVDEIDDGRSPARPLHFLRRSLDGRFVAGNAVGSEDLWIAEVEGPEPTAFTELLGHESFVYQVAFSPDGDLIASAAPWNHVRVWDGYTGEPLATFERTGVVPKQPEKPNLGHGHVNKAAPLVFARDGNSLLTIDTDERVRLRYSDEMLLQGDEAVLVRYDLLTGEVERVAELSAHDVCANARPYLEVLLPELEIDGRPRRVNGRLSIGPDGAVAYAGPAYDLLEPSDPGRVLDAQSGGELEFPIGLAEGVGLSSDGRWLAVAERGQVRVHETAGGALVVRLLDESPSRFHYAAGFSPSDDRLAVGSDDGVVRLVETEHWQVVATLPPHADYVYDLAWSPDGTRLVTASGDGTLRLYDARPWIPRHLQAENRAERVRQLSERVPPLAGDRATSARAWLERVGDEPDRRQAALQALLRSWSSDPGPRTATSR